MADEGVQRYLDGIESQHKTKPKYMTHLEKILEKIDAATIAAAGIPKAYHVHDAAGKQLDTTARYVGADRRFPPVAIPGIDPLLPDSIFRKVVLARIVQNQWDGTEEGFSEIWDATMGAELDAVYTDNQDMTISVDITGYTEPIMVELILAGYIVPKPLGVGINVNITEDVIADAEASFHPTFAGLVACNSGRQALPCPYEAPAEDATQVLAGCRAAFSGARIGLPLYQSEQQSTDTVRVGAAFYANHARIAFPVSI